MKDITAPPTPTPVHPIRVARDSQGLSREGLAFKADVSLKTIERIESGQVTPRRATLNGIARALGVEPEELAA